MAHFVMTDKTPTKTLPCAFTGCEHTVEVTKFFTPSKARCPEHRGKTSAAVRVAVATPAKAVPKAEQNHSIGQLMCPLCKAPMAVIKVDEDMGWPTLKCADCLCAVEIKPNWGPMVMSNVKKTPLKIRGFIEILNKEYETARKERIAKQG